MAFLKDSKSSFDTFDESTYNFESIKYALLNEMCRLEENEEYEFALSKKKNLLTENEKTMAKNDPNKFFNNKMNEILKYMSNKSIEQNETFYLRSYILFYVTFNFKILYQFKEKFLVFLKFDEFFNKLEKFECLEYFEEIKNYVEAQKQKNKYA